MMGYYTNETEARNDIANTIRPIYGNVSLFVGERNALSIGLREVIFVIRATNDNAKSESAINAIYSLQTQQPIERLEWQGTKIDFLNDNETEYIMVKAVIENGN